MLTIEIMYTVVQLSDKPSIININKNPVDPKLLQLVKFITGVYPIYIFKF